MKIKPQIYAQLLMEGIESKASFEKMAENLWHILQKNKQYKDLPKILEMLDLEYARKNGATLAKVYSEKPLTDQEITEIKSKLSSHSSNNKFVIKNILKPNCGGISVEFDDKTIDMSVLGKIDKLKTKLTNIT